MTYFCDDEVIEEIIFVKDTIKFTVCYDSSSEYQKMTIESDEDRTHDIYDVRDMIDDILSYIDRKQKREKIL